MSLVLLMEGGGSGNEEAGKPRPPPRRSSEREPPPPPRSDLPPDAREGRFPAVGVAPLPPPPLGEWNPAVEAGYPSSLSFEGSGSVNLPMGGVYHRDEGMIMELERAQTAFFGYHSSVERDRGRSEEMVRHHLRESHSEETEEEDRKPMARRLVEYLDPSLPMEPHHEDPYFISPYAPYPPPYAALPPPERYPPSYRSHQEFYPYYPQPQPYPPGMTMNEPLAPTETLDVRDFPLSSPVTLPSVRAPSYEADYGLSSVPAVAPAVATAEAAEAAHAPPPSSEEPLELTEERLYPSDAELAGAKHERDRRAIVKWYERFRELIDFKNETGHCSVPQKYNKNKQLGSWVNKMRDLERQRKQGRVNFLNDRMWENLRLVGFVSAKPKGDPLWMLRYHQLKEFYRVAHHANVPTKYAANRALGRWVSTQRLQYRLYSLGHPSSMTPDRIHLLEELGFVWDAAPDREATHGDHGYEDGDSE